jgi:hypothetical protein
MHTHIYAHYYIFIHTYIHTYIHIQTYTHTHTHMSIILFWAGRATAHQRGGLHTRTKAVRQSCFQVLQKNRSADPRTQLPPATAVRFMYVRDRYMRMYSFMGVYVCVCVYIYIYIYTRTHAYIHIHIHIHTYIHACMNTRVCALACTDLYEHHTRVFNHCIGSGHRCLILHLNPSHSILYTHTCMLVLMHTITTGAFSTTLWGQ